MVAFGVLLCFIMIIIVMIMIIIMIFFIIIIVIITQPLAGHFADREPSHWRGTVVSPLCCATRRGRSLPHELCSFQDNDVFGLFGC